MKVYKFFQKPKKHLKQAQFSDLSMELKYPLYAITNDKKIAKKFKETRNMELFIERIGKMDKTDFEKYRRIHHEHMLVEEHLETIQNKLTNHQQPMYARVVLTETESSFVMDAIDTGGILNEVKSWIPIEIFNEKIQEALHLIKYEKAYRFLGFDPWGGPTDDFFDLGFEFDQLAIFIILYGDTLVDNFYTNLKLYKAYG